MQYTVEDTSPVQKKVLIEVPVEEVDAALSVAIASYRSNVQLDGFRKGKVPGSVIESRFRKEITNEATTDLVNVHINQILGETKAEPISRIDFHGESLERNTPFSYSITFEILPEFELPEYIGLPVSQEKADIDEAQVAEVIARMQQNLSELNLITDVRCPNDGEVAVIDFIAKDDAGKPIPGIKADNFQFTIGDGQALEDFEALVKSIKSGDSAERAVSFPDDFLNPDMAGKTVTMHVTTHAIKERKLPELDDEFAKKAGGFESMEKMRTTIRESYMKNREELCMADAQKGLLDGVLAQCEFLLPPSMVESYIGNLLGDLRERLERQGKGLHSLGKTPEQLQEEARPEAEHFARVQIFLLGVARKEAISVSEQEVDQQLRQMAIRSGQEYQQLRDYYRDNNLIFALRDRLLADKAMDFIYKKAVITEVPAGSLSKDASAPAPEEDASKE